MTPVTDPELLAQLEGERQPVSDPAVLSQLEGGDTLASNLAKIDAQQAAESFEEPSTFAYLFNRAKKGFAGFMGAPGDVLKMLRSRPGTLIPNPMLSTLANEGARRVMPSEETLPTERVMATSGTYREAFGHDPEMKTSSDAMRYAGGVVEMGAAGGPFGLATKPAALFPLATGTVGSGIGMEFGGDAASGLGLSRDVGEAVGALGGGVASAIAPNALTAAGGAIKRRFSPSAQKASAESAVGREIGAQIESYPPARGNIDRSLEISDDIQGFSPSLPARSNAPGLLAEERRLVSQSSTTLTRAVANLEANNKAIAEFVDTKFPAVGGETAAHRVKKLITLKADRLEGIRTVIDDKLDDAVRVFESNPTNFENGNRLRDLFQKQKQVYAGIRSQKYTEVYEAADRLGVKADIDDVVQYADDVLKNELNAYQASEIPPVFRQLAKGGPSGEVSFAKLHSLYKRANADLASLRGSMRPDKDFQVMLLEGLKTRLRGKIDAFEGEGFGEVATKLKEANRFYAEEYVPRFKQGFGSDVAARYPSGEFRTPDQLVTELVTRRPNNTQAARDFKLLFDEVPEAWQSLRAGYLDELYRNAGVIDKSGRINQRALDSFLRKHEPTLKEFPQIRGELKQLALDNSALLERRGAIVALEKRLAANDLFKLFQGKDPNVVLSEATTNRNAMRVLAFQTRKDPDMAKALARGVAEHVAMQPDPAAYLAANREAIHLGLAPHWPTSMGRDHMRNLETAVEAMTINSRSVPPTSVNAASVSPDALGERIGSSPRALVSAYLSVQRGRTGAEQEGAAILGRWFDKIRREHKLVVMEAAFYDKNTAQALANMARNPQSEKAKLDFATQMTSLGVRAEVAGQE